MFGNIKNVHGDLFRFTCDCGHSDLSAKIVCEECNDSNVVITEKDLEPIIKRLEALEKKGNHGR